MNENIKTKVSSQQLADQITKHIEELATETDAARVSEEMLRYLDMCAKFHSYSWCNTWLILMACPHATQVAGFRKWQSLNRFVKKGEHGIPILAPILVKEKIEDGNDKSFLRGFKVVFVFDISQTSGQPLPDPPSWRSPEKNIELQERLIAFAKEKGIVVTEKVLAGEIQGVSRGGSIDLAPEAGTSTLIHEIAHEMMHHSLGAPVERDIRELEAESVAYVVSRYFGLESSGSPNYITLHGVTADGIRDHMERIRKEVVNIISAIQQLQ